MQSQELMHNERKRGGGKYKRMVQHKQIKLRNTNLGNKGLLKFNLY